MIAIFVRIMAIFGVTFLIATSLYAESSNYDVNISNPTAQGSTVPGTLQTDKNNDDKSLKDKIKDTIKKIDKRNEIKTPNAVIGVRE